MVILDFNVSEDLLMFSIYSGSGIYCFIEALARLLILLISYLTKGIECRPATCIDFVCQGHDTFITGEAGTGKTHLLSRLFWQDKWKIATRFMSRDYYQLPPVPNYDDEGQFAFLCSVSLRPQLPVYNSYAPESANFQYIFKWNQEIRKGFCNTDYQLYASQLGRHIDPSKFGSNWLTQVCCTNNEVDYTNFE